MRALSAILPLALIAGCATPTESYVNPLSLPPPSLQSLQDEIERAPPCASEHLLRTPAVETPIPKALSRCPAVFPEGLERAGVEGACRSMFDLDGAGAPINIESRCTVGHIYRRLPDDWAAVAAQALAYATRKAIAQHSYPAADDASAAGKWRNGLSQGMRFQFEGEPARLPYPPAFDRASPATPMTAEQIEFYARSSFDRASPTPESIQDN